MGRNKYLVHLPLSDGDYLYYINNEIEFIFVKPPPLPLNRQDEGTITDRIAQSSKLKEAIQIWIGNLANPNPAFPTGADSQGSSVIAACESHLLFPDLTNHLPVLGIDVCARWSEYKKELVQLDKLKQNLISALSTGILECFDGLDLHFIYDNEHYRGDYDCYLSPLILYDVVLRLESNDEGYDHHMKFFSWLENNAPIVEEGDHVLWGKVIPYLRVPKKDRALLETSVPKFLAFFENIPSSEFITMARDIIATVDKLKSERDRILRELEQTLLYANLPGNCQYLG
jgi:hypothetical protein